MKALTTIILVLLGVNVFAQENILIQHLTTDLVEETDIVYNSGYATNVSLEMYLQNADNLQVALIHNQFPRFSWQILDPKNGGTMQSQYRVLVASSLQLLEEGKCDVWDSGIVDDNKSSGVVCEGNSLQPNQIYYWKVKISTKRNKWTEYSVPKCFVTASQLDGLSATIPLQKFDENPTKISIIGGKTIADFGKDAIAQLKLKIDESEPRNVIVKIGEEILSSGINEKPGGTRSYNKYQIALFNDFLSIPIAKPNFATNVSGVLPIYMPSYIGEVLPFRYCQIEGNFGKIGVNDIVRTSVNYAFDDNASNFESSDTTLNQIWQLCKHSIKATTFAGLFVDGNRERIPYEADAVIHQLGWYSFDNHYSIARKTLEHLIFNPTWPTEWILQTLMLAWNDYLYTGDDYILNRYYNDLKYKTLLFLRNDSNGLIYTGYGITDRQHLDLVHFKGNTISDIVDWPPSETDGFEKKQCNTVVNAFHYQAMNLLSKIASAIGKESESMEFAKKAEETKKSINSLLRNEKGLYIDGIGSKHNSLHGNMFPLAFSIVPEKSKNIVKQFVETRQMACSVYGAQFLMDALYEAGLDDYALRLLTDSGKRSWYNMITSGSTITTEAWDDSFKNNQDWTHAWGAAPANVIVRHLMGIQPLSPGFAEVSIAPKPGALESADISVPTPKGNIKMSFQNSEFDFDMTVTIPSNVKAYIQLPGDIEVTETPPGEHHFYKVKEPLETSNSESLDNQDIVEMEIPNIFTPNGDGVNDNFYINYLDDYPERFVIEIYNRSGTTIFKSLDPDFRWDASGTTPGTYFYSIKCNSKLTSGTVLVVK